MPFKKGVSGNPNGRNGVTKPRQQLTERTLRILASEVKKYGADAVRKAREQDPLGFMRLVVSCIPPEQQKLSVEHTFSDVLLDAVRSRQLPAAAPRTIDGETIRDHDATIVSQPIDLQGKRQHLESEASDQADDRPGGKPSS